jgi:Xaa-Pro dipeptidase
MVPARHSIPATDFAERRERLRSRMRELRLDAVLLGTGMNLQYFSGLPSPQRNVARPFFLLVPRLGDPRLFCHAGLAEECYRFAHVTDIRVYEGLSRVPVDLLDDAIVEAGASTGRIGMELGYEQSLDISPLELRRMQNSLPSADWIDVADLLWELRMIKSETEIACMREACDIVADGYEFTFRAFHGGMSEHAVFDRMLNCLQTSGSDTFLAITSGRGNYDLVSKPPETRLLESGDMLWMDAGCRVGGYWSDYSRAAVAGPPSDLQQRVQQQVSQITFDTIDQIRPGVSCSEVARYALSRLEALPYTVTSSIAARAGRVGHGIGLTMTEPPHLGVHDLTSFRPGMVVTVEPGVATEYGTFHVEENVVVREGACELLSRSSRTLAQLDITPPA